MATKTKRAICPVCGSEVDKKTFLTDGTCAGCGESLLKYKEIEEILSNDDEPEIDFAKTVDSYKKAKRSKVSTNRSRNMASTIPGKIVKPSSSKEVAPTPPKENPQSFYPVEISDEELEQAMSKLQEDISQENSVEADDFYEGEDAATNFDDDELEVIELADEEEYVEEEHAETYSQDAHTSNDDEEHILKRMRIDLEAKENIYIPDETDEISDEEAEVDAFESDIEEDVDSEKDNNGSVTQDDSTKEENIPEKKESFMSVADLIRQKCNSEQADIEELSEKREVPKETFSSNEDGYYDDTQASEPPQADIIPRKVIFKIAGTIIGLILLTLFFIYYA